MAGRTVVLPIKVTVDSTGAVSGLNTVQGAVKRVDDGAKAATSAFSQLRTMVGLVAGSMAIRELGQFMASSVRAASEQQAAMTQLAVALGNVGVAYNDVGKEMAAMFAQYQRTTRFGDDTQMKALQALVQTTGDYGSAMKLLAPVMDLAAAKQMDLASAAELVGRAGSGNIGMLSRYGIVLDDNTKQIMANGTAMERAEALAAALNARFGGAAAADVETYAGSVAKLSSYWGDLKETLGAVVTETGAGRDAFNALIPIIEKLTEAAGGVGSALVGVFAFDWSAQFKLTLANAGLAFVAFARSVAEAMKDIPIIGQNAPKALHELQWLDAELKKVASTAAGEVATATGNAAEAMAKFWNTITNTRAAAGDLAGGGVSGGGSTGGATGGSLSKLALMFEELESAVAAAQFGLEQYQRQMRDLGGSAAEVAQGVAEMADAAAQSFTDEWLRTATGPNAAWAIGLEDTFSDLLGKGFMGELESFQDIWDAIWQDLAKSMVGILGDAFQNWMTNRGGEEGQSFGDFFKSTTEGMKGSLAAGLAGAGMVYSANQQGGGGGAMQGAMGGLMAGASIAGPWGAVIGAVVGGLIGYFGGQEDSPTTTYSLGKGGFDITDTTGHQGMTGEKREVWEQSMNAVVLRMREQWRSILALFMDASLFDMVDALGSMPASKVKMTAADLAKWLTEVALPDIFESAFATAINTGLGGLGVSEETMDRLWSEVGKLPGSERMSALEDYIRAVVGLTELAGDMEWSAITGDVGANSMERFREAMGDVLNQISVALAGWDDLSLIERARQAQDIEAMISQAREAEIAMLQQIHQLQLDISRSIASQIEGLALGGMTDVEQATYLQGRISDLMGQLGGAGSAEEVAYIMQQLQAYISQLAGALGDQLYEVGNAPGGGTWAEYLQELLASAGDMAADALQGFADEIQATNDLFIAALEEALAGLQDFGGGASDVSYNLDDFSGALDRGTDAVGRFIQMLESASGSGSASSMSMSSTSSTAATLTTRPRKTSIQVPIG